MHKTIRKALDELNKENPRLDYVRGMLEVLVDEDKGISLPATVMRDIDTGKPKLIKPEPVVDDEAKMLDAYGKAMLGKVDQTAIQTEN